MEAKRQPKLRTFEDVFNRMRWDDKYVMEDMTMGYDDRLLGAMEMPLHDFVPVAEGGDLPMHRVWYIRDRDKVLWDRRRKLDLVFNSGLTPAILAAGSGSTDEETARRINQSMQNLQMLEEQRQHNLDVQLHAQRHAAARAAGTLPRPPPTIKGSIEIEHKESGCGDSHLGLLRQNLISALFGVCDVDGDCFLSMDEMRMFANLTGFDGSDQEWRNEFTSLCSEHSANGCLGIDVALFEKLVNDESECGCYCTDDELQEFAAEVLQKQAC